MNLSRRTILLLFLSWTATTKGDAAASAAQAATEAVKSSGALKHLDYRYFVAGGTCAAISHGITTPIDVVKTKIQAHPEKYNKGMVSAALDIMKTDGPGALLGGLGPTVVGYGIEGAMKFGVYEVMKPILANLLSDGSSNGDTTALAFLLASVVAGGVAAILLCPMESTRIRIVTDPKYSDKGLLTGLPKLIKEEGFISTFAGLWAMLAKQVPYTLGKQVSFDVFAKALYQFLESVKDNLSLVQGQIKWIVSILAAFCASLVACIFSQPGDMILTETYRPPEEKKVTVTMKKAAPASSRSSSSTPTKKPRGRKYKFLPKVKEAPPPAPVVVTTTVKDAGDRSFPGVIRTIHTRGGVPAFFTGTGARIVHVGLIITSQLVIYDIVKQLLGLPATGKH